MSKFPPSSPGAADVYDRDNHNNPIQYIPMPEKGNMANAAVFNPSVAKAGQARPDEPPLPPQPRSKGGKIQLWLDWYHAMKEAGYKCTLPVVAEKSGYSPGYVKQLHQKYQSRPDLTKLTKTSN